MHELTWLEKSFHNVKLSNLHVKYIEILFVSHTSTKLEKENKFLNKLKKITRYIMWLYMNYR